MQENYYLKSLTFYQKHFRTNYILTVYNKKYINFENIKIRPIIFRYSEKATSLTISFH